jgi:hypothetical protein
LKQKASQYPVFQYPASQIYIAICQLLPIRWPQQLRRSWKNKPSGAQGQSFFWEPVNKDIPETGFTQPKTRQFPGQ